MKVARIQVDGTAPVAAVARDGALHPLAHDVADLIGGAEPGAEAAALPDAALLPPVVPGKIVAIGLNYLDHIRESGLEAPTRPLVFAKFTSSLIADGGGRSGSRSTLTGAASTGRSSSPSSSAGARTPSAVGDALSHVFGYTVANDVSARDLQQGRRPVGACEEPGLLLPAGPGRRHRRRDPRSTGAAAGVPRQRRGPCRTPRPT